MWRVIFLVLLLVSLGACSGSGDGGGFLTADPRGLSNGGASLAAAPGAEAGDAAAEIARAIEEADLYRVDGDRLYVLNAWRGFTVIDLAAPALVGRLALGGVPREMFLRDERAFVLLSTMAGGTELFEVSVADPAQPVLVASHALEGEFRTSRLVGNVLLALAGDALHSFAVEPELASVASLPIPGGARFAHSTDAWLFAAAPEGPASTRVTLVDVSDPAGALELRGAITLPGFVSDEFKLHFGAGTLRVVTHEWTDGALSQLFVVDVSDPDAPFVRANLELVRGEQLFATRFTDETAYVVTFEQVDPLWIVDLTDPDQPAIAAELEVPGWSTHLVALPGRLVALGIDPADGWHAIASLFDVSDPTQPALAARVDFGWGWSSAFADVRGFGVFEDEGLVLVPFASETNRLAVLDLGPDTLALRGFVEAEGTVLRGFPHEQGLCALSVEELVIAEPATLDVTGRVTIARDVADAARSADGSLIEAVRRSSGCRVGDVDLPLAFSELHAHADLFAVTGFDAQGAAAHVIDFASAPPSVSERIALGPTLFPTPAPGGWGAPQAGALFGPGGGSGRSLLTDGGRLVVPWIATEEPELAVGSGDLQGGFSVLDLAQAQVETTIGVRGAFVTGFVLEGERLSFTYGRDAGADAQGRPLLRHELVDVDLTARTLASPVNVPGFVVSRAGALAHTVEETWGADWSFEVAVVAAELAGGSATVLDRMPLASGAYDFRAAGSTLWFTSYGTIAVGPLPAAPDVAFAPSATIATVRLGAELALGPELVYDQHFATLLLSEEQSALVVVDGLALERWEVGGEQAQTSWGIELGAWPQSARAEDLEGAYLLALGYGESLVVP